MALEWPKETLLARDLWKCHRSTHIPIFIISEKALLALRGWRVLIMEKEFIKKSSFLHRVFQMFWVCMKWVKKHSCVFLSLVLQALAAPCRTHPSVWRFQLSCWCKLLLEGLIPWDLASWSFCPIPLYTLTVLQGSSFGPKAPLAIFLSLLALRVCKADSWLSKADFWIRVYFLERGIELCFSPGTGDTSLPLGNIFPASFSSMNFNSQDRYLCQVLLDHSSLSPGLYFQQLPHVLGGLGGSFLSFHTSGNTFPHESGKSLCSTPHFLPFLLSLLCPMDIPESTFPSHKCTVSVEVQSHQSKWWF